MKQARKLSLLAGVLCTAIAGLAIANVWGTTSVAEFVGTTGKTFTLEGAGVVGGVRSQALDVFIQKDTSTTPAQIAGALAYRSRRDLTSCYIHRFKYEIKDPNVGSWTTVVDVTEPDSRIINPSTGTYNTFSDSFTHADAARGLVVRATVWESASDTNPNVLSAGWIEP